MSEIVIAHSARTAIGNYGGALKGTPAPDLGALVIREVLSRAEIPGEAIGSVIMGNVVQAGNKMNPARQAAIAGGVPVSVPALIVNRVCGSGLQSVISGAQEIALGNENAVLAGGIENMDRAPYLIPGGRWGYRMGNAELIDAMLWDGLHDAFSGKHSGWHTEDLVARYGLTRDEQDQFAARSQQRFGVAQSEGKFAAEIVPIELPGRKGTTTFDRDEAPRPDTTVEILSKLKPAFRTDGTITAGNAPGLNSGAAAMIVADRAFAERQGIAPSARIVAWGVGAVEPGLFGLGPIPAVRKALDRAGWDIADIERAEINEAFAAVPLIVARELKLPLENVNVEGGAIAHGHPIGATGAVLTTRLVHSMQRDAIKRGLVTLCIGGGQGVALLLERI